MVCYDHLGNRFKTKTERAKHYNLSLEVVDYRLSQGWDLKDALTKSKHDAHIEGGYRTKGKLSKRITAPNGVEYSSIVDMCNAYGISHSLYDHRLARGWSQEEALSPARGRNRNSVRCEDENGKQYESIKQLSENLSIPYQTILNRRQKGMTIEEALREKRLFNGIYECEDHLGNKYDTFKLMCKAYDKSPNTVRGRLKAGAALKEALTTPIQKGGKRWIAVQA